MGEGEEKKSRAIRKAERDEPWSAPQPLDDPPLPIFPTSALPTWLRTWVEAQAEALRVPRDLPAMLALATFATACAKRFEVKIRKGWIEPVNLYLLVALASGTRKSVVFDAATAPILAFEIEQAKRAKAALTAAQLTDKEARLRLVVDAEPVAERPKGRVVALDAQGAFDSCTFVSDATPERVASLIAENAGRLAVLSDEGEICSIIAGRYGGSFDVFLKAHSGRVLTIERQGRGRVHTRRPALTLGLAVQPDVLQSLASKRAVRERGLFARFLVAVPASNLGRRVIAPTPVADHVVEGYASNVSALLKHEARLNDDGEIVPTELSLGAEAHALFMSFEAEVEALLREDGTLGVIASWGSKLPGAVARIAGLLALADSPGESQPEIRRAHVTAAIEIGRYAIAHALTAFAQAGADRDLTGARVILRWLRSHGVAEITKRDLHKALRSQFQRAQEIDGPIRVLRRRGHVRLATRGEKPGRPSLTIRLNPTLSPKNSARGHM